MGSWFNIVGKLVGVEFSEIESNVLKNQSLEQNFNRMFRLQ